MNKTRWWVTILTLVLCISTAITPQRAFAFEGGTEDEFIPENPTQGGKPEYLQRYDYRVWMNGAFQNIEVGPQTEAAVKLYPLRAVLEADGVTVGYEAASRIVSAATRNGAPVKLNLRNGEADGYGKFQVMVTKDRTLVELRFFDLFGLSVEEDEYIKTLVVSSDRVRYGDVIPYTLGQSAFAPSTIGGKEVSYVMNGAMAVPDKQNSPVVIFMHGTHPAIEGEEEKTGNYLGFGYLMQALAKEGYAVFSLNMNKQFSWVGAEPDEVARASTILSDLLSRIQEANQGKDLGFPLSLSDRVDTQNITLVGHSRNGFYCFTAAPAVDKLGAKVNGILSFAPGGGIPEELQYSQSPAAFLLPDLDGDFSSLDGQKIYDVLIAEEGRAHDSYLAHFYGGNHAALNEALLEQDYRGGKEDLMPPEEQRQVYTAYVLDFVKAVNKDGRLLALPHPLNGDFYGKKALVSYAGAKRIELLKAGGVYETPAEAGGAVVKEVVASSFSGGTAGSMNLPGNIEALPLVQISWEKQGARAYFALRSHTDATGSQVLTIKLAQDSGSELNKRTDQAMSVILTDKAGQSARVHLPKGTAALGWQKGNVLDIPGWDDKPTGEKQYSNFTPLSDVVLPLDQFKGIDQKALRSITLEFDEPSGCVVVQSAYLS